MTNFWSKVLNEAEKTRLVDNIAGHLKNAKQFIQKRAVRMIIYFFSGYTIYSPYVFLCFCIFVYANNIINNNNNNNSNDNDNNNNNCLFEIFEAKLNYKAGH